MHVEAEPPYEELNLRTLACSEYSAEFTVQFTVKARGRSLKYYLMLFTAGHSQLLLVNRLLDVGQSTCRLKFPTLSVLDLRPFKTSLAPPIRKKSRFISYMLLLSKGYGRAIERRREFKSDGGRASKPSLP